MSLKIRKNRSEPPPPLCPIGACMQVLGGMWTPNLIWHLSGGPRRFGELKIDVPAISAKMLSLRLKDLEDKGVVTRTVMPTSPPSVEYALTELGAELVPVLRSIIDVGHRLKERKTACTARHIKPLTLETAQSRMD